MKKIFILFSMLAAIAGYGQNNAGDSTLKVVYANTINNAVQPALFINEKLMGSSSAPSILSPNLIDSLYIIKGEVEIDGVKYNGQVHIITKSSYNPKLITLTALKDKYTNLKNKPALFMVNGNMINADYDKFAIDENDVLEIIVDNIKNEKEHIDLGLIKLLTKTEENIKKSKTIMIRGREVAMH
ncbi:hypothetical protein [Parafilimonas sp.]|uniref:hypothetical protein n=1 Tax=Parafilimonas sp. TaxID=1969739 RepID=UPI0039E565AC